MFTGLVLRLQGLGHGAGRAWRETKRVLQCQMIDRVAVVSLSAAFTFLNFMGVKNLGPSMQIGKEASPQAGLKKKLEKGYFVNLNIFYCGCSC